MPNPLPPPLQTMQAAIAALTTSAITTVQIIKISKKYILIPEVKDTYFDRKDIKKETVKTLSLFLAAQPAS
jgi:Holliday junction resolvase